VDLTEIKARLESIAANKAPTTSYSVAFDLPGGGLYDPQHYADYLRPSASEDDPLWYVCAPMRPSRPDAVPVACITGNGPNGKAHAELFAHAFDDLSALVAEVENLRVRVETFEPVRRLSLSRAKMLQAIVQEIPSAYLDDERTVQHAIQEIRALKSSWREAMKERDVAREEAETLREELEEAKSEIDRLNWSIHSLKYVFPLG
jgi:hypothetical protein